MTTKDEAGPQTPPAVGEYAVSEREQLLARIDAQAREIERLVEALERATKLLSAAAGYATKMEPMPAKLLNAIDAKLDAHKAGGA